MDFVLNTHFQWIWHSKIFVSMWLDCWMYTHTRVGGEGGEKGEREGYLVGGFLFFLSLFQEQHGRYNYGPVCHTLTGGPKVLSFETKAAEKGWL